MKLPTEQVSKINHAEAGLKIRTARERAGMSVRRLAADMKISPMFLSDMERGRRNWTEERFWQAEKAIMEHSE